MPEDIATDEYRGKSEDEKNILCAYREALGYSKDFCRPYFQEAVRMYRLFAGHIPPEVEGTFSQVMLNFAYSIIENELPISMRAMYSTPEWISLVANDFMLEPAARTATKWVRHQLENVQKLGTRITPTMQSGHIFGNGYRFYEHRYVPQTHTRTEPNYGFMGTIDPMNPTREIQTTTHKSVISGQYVNFFNVLPSPSGSIINPEDRYAEPGLDWLLTMMYPSKSYIEQQSNLEGFNKEQAGRLFEKQQSDTDYDPTEEFKDEIINTDGQWNQFTAPHWVRKMRDAKHLDQRYRTCWFMQPDRWSLIAEDRYVLWSGPPRLGMWPVAHYKAQFNLDNFFGTSLLKVVEDLIISMILNFNMRLDYLAGVFHPTTWAPQKLIDEAGGDLSAFDRRPYKVSGYQHTQYAGGLQQYLFHDQMEPLDQQAFLEQGQMKEYLEDIISQHNNQQLASSTATVGATLISQDVARSMVRAMNLDMTGQQQSAEATLRLGAKHKHEDEMIRTGADGMPWENIPHEAINDGYGIEIAGARHMAQAEESFKKMLTVAPMLLNDPELQGGIEMKRQLLEAGGFKNRDTIVQGERGRDPMERYRALPAENRLPGGIPSLRNEARSAANRTGRAAGGTPTMAGASAI